MASLVAAVGVLAGGCAVSGSGVDRLTDGVGYYWQSIAGHFSLMQRAQPVEHLLTRTELDATTRKRLALARDIRRFAVTELGLPDNGSYTRFAQVDQPFVTWGVVAAPELSLRLTQWCFPIAGCVTYRGYYSLAAAERYAARLAATGLDVQVSGVPAYSTLGWFDDPLLSTFINYPDAEVARLIFHELSHQMVYVPGDSMFNESFATAVEQLGVERWLETNGTAQQRLNYRQQQLRRDRFLDLLGRHRDKLATLYASTASDDEKRAGKRRVFDELRAEYQEMRKGPWAGFTGYDRWFNRPLGNAHLGSIATYTTWVPVFRQLFAESGQDFRRFLVRAGEVAALEQTERHAFLVRRSHRLSDDSIEPVTPMLPGTPPEMPVPLLQQPDQARSPGDARADARAVQAGPPREPMQHQRDEVAPFTPGGAAMHARQHPTGANISSYQ
ncbi:MAG: aminopeptidase [Burkholderiaceae bacterium]|nr:aminopeptidase [Burkholderiaceae bacterium]